MEPPPRPQFGAKIGAEVGAEVGAKVGAEVGAEVGARVRAELGTKAEVKVEVDRFAVLARELGRSAELVVKFPGHETLWYHLRCVVKIHLDTLCKNTRPGVCEWCVCV